MLHSLWRMLRALGAALFGSIAGAFVGVVVVDYTDANASHTVANLAVVGICAVAGLGLALWAHLGRAAEPVPRYPSGPPTDPRPTATSHDRPRPIEPGQPAS